MADNGRWFKLWCASINDPDLTNLDVADFGRWAKLGAYIKEHGTDGGVTLTEPSKMICAMLQLPTLKDVIKCFEEMRNVTVSSETNMGVSFSIKYDNWLKYQGDFSTDRVRKFRAKNTQMKRSKRRGEEKRGEENKKRVFIVPTLEEIKAYCKERKNNVNPEKWLNHYQAKNWMIGKNKMVDWQAAVRTWEEDGFTSGQEADREKLKRDLKQSYQEKEIKEGYLNDMSEADKRRPDYLAEVEKINRKIAVIEKRIQG